MFLRESTKSLLCGEWMVQRMSNRLFQGVLHQMHDTVDRVLGVVDETGDVIACTELGMIGEKKEDLDTRLLTCGSAGFVFQNNTYRPFGIAPRTEYAVFVSGTDEMAEQYAAILAISLRGMKEFYDEKYDRSSFIKNLILDNILPGDIYIKSGELHFNEEVHRAVLLIRIISKNEISAYEVIQNLFPDKLKDFIINVNETDIALVKEIKPSTQTKDLEKLARSIVDTLGSEFYTHAVVGISTAVVGIKDLAKAFKEAQIALEVGKVFDTDKAIVSYDNLGIARLVYQLPGTLCEMFLDEVFKKGSIESLDQETLFTIQKFFENNLNVSETSRRLFVHRNTLVYRIEKIKKKTGLDLREFDHAIVFKVAMMVKKYLDSRPVRF